MPPPLPNELTPLTLPVFQDHRKAVRSYTQNDLCAFSAVLPNEREQANLPSRGTMRARSLPTLFLEDLEGEMIPMSPLFCRKFYMTAGGTMTSSAFNLASATLGAGVLALPHAMYNSGLLLGSLLLTMICVGTIYSVFLLAKVSAMTGLHTFEELSMHLLGRIPQMLAALIIFIFCCGAAVMFVVIMGDFVSPFIPLFHLQRWFGRKRAMIFFWSLIMLPLSLAKSMHALRYASIVGAASTLLLAFAIIDRFVRQRVEGLPINHVPLVRIDGDTIGALSTFLFSFCCQPVVFKVQSEMHDGTVQRMSLCASCAMGCCTLLYLITGIFGAMTFGSDAAPNVLFNFVDHLDVPSAKLAYAGMALTVTMVFPMTIFPTRDTVVLAMGYREEWKPAPWWLPRTVAGLLALFSLLVGIYVPNIRVLFDLLGGMCGGVLSFLLPAAFALRSGHWTREEVGPLHVFGAWIIFVSGLVMCAVGTYNSVLVNLLAAPPVT